MRKLLMIGLVAAAALAQGCMSHEETTWDKYREWREYNNAWIQQQVALSAPDGKPYYQTIVPDWNPGIFVLMHRYTDPAETEGNLTPLFNSTVDVRYRLTDIEGEPIDSSLALTTYGPGIARFTLSSLVSGWAAAMEHMRCGDSVRVIVPYAAGYGSAWVGSTLQPYSTLVFDIRLVDIPFYERPNN